MIRQKSKKSHWEKIKSSREDYFILPKEEWSKTDIPDIDEQAQSLPEDQKNFLKYYCESDFIHKNYIAKNKTLVTKILCKSEIEGFSTRRYEYFKEWERLVFHEFSLVREGKIVTTIEDAHIVCSHSSRKIQESKITGATLLEIFMPGIREGDELHISFTIYQYYPNTHPHFLSEASFAQFGEKAGSQRHIVWAPQEMSLNIETRGPSLEIQFTKTFEEVDQGYVKYEWFVPVTPSFEFEEEMPNSYQIFPKVSISSCLNWSEVSTIFETHFSLPKTHEEADAVFLEITSSQSTLEENALACIDYVQKNLRYKHFNEIQTSLKPNTLSYILQNEIGDCKDKTLLLVYFLRKLGLEACPALVNTRGSVNEYSLPTLYAFNHAICALEFKGITYWIDPTLSYDSGLLKNRTYDYHNNALLIRPGTGSLTLMPIETTDHEDVFECADFRDVSEKKEVPFFISRTLKGRAALVVRENLAEFGQVAGEKYYLEAFQEFYPSAILQDSIEIKDDLAENQITLKESYLIKDLADFPKTEEGEIHVRPIVHPLRHFPLNVPEDRQHPIVLPFPLHREYQLKVLLPLKTIKEKLYDEEKKNPFFRFQVKQSVEKGCLTLDCKLQTLAGVVPTDKAQEYWEAYKDAWSPAVLFVSKDLFHKEKKGDWIYYIIAFLFIKFVVALFSR